MAWNTVGNLKGPRGDIGPAGSNGISVANTAIDAGGQLIVTLSNGQTINAGVARGAAGADGTSVNIEGTVANAAALPAGQNAGDGYITADDGHLHVSDGAGGWTDVGLIRGPKGDQGLPGAQGIRGSQWYTGTGAPNGTNTAGAAIGDKYLDLTTGDVYNLS